MRSSPIGIFVRVFSEVDRLTGAGEVVELAGLHCLANFLIDQGLPTIHEFAQLYTGVRSPTVREGHA
jgi:hypothetical protein